MENMNTNDNKLYHKFIILLDNELAERLYNHAAENDMKLCGVVRRSLRIYLQDDENRNSPKMVKKNK